jgi:alpha-L-fucosidase 2
MRPASRIITLIALSLIAHGAGAEPTAQPTNILLYNKPAEDWMSQALPIGNGYMGAMFFGGIDEEHIQFSEGSLWAGGPGAHPDYDFGNRKGAAANLPKVRALIRAGKMSEAHELANKTMTGVIHKERNTGLDFGDYGAQQTMGDLYVSQSSSETVSEYRRVLDIDKALGSVTFQEGLIRHERRFFASYPDRVLVYQFANNSPEGITYMVRVETPHPVDRTAFENATLILEGHLADNQLGFENRVMFQTDGTLQSNSDGTVTITKAKSLTLCQSAATAYANQYPGYRGADYKAVNAATQARVSGQSYDELYAAHLQDYARLYNRMELHLGRGEDIPETTDARLRAYDMGATDPALEALLFQYARYLTIAASRPGTMPMHLQGKWNDKLNPPWSCDYHTNINQQMLYWPAEVTNLSECAEPLLDYIGSLVAPGRVSAAEHFGARGWVVNTMNNAYGFTAPGWDFPWGFYPAGAGWLCQHLWEHYDFTRDEGYLRRAYPVMAEAAIFWIDYLQEDGKGRLASIPSYSPEHGGISAGASMDHQIAWDLLNNCLQAAEALHIEDDFTRSARAVRDRIVPPTVGRWGQLQEWVEDLDDPKNDHRHVSHLFALYPGAQIDRRFTPAWAEAAKTSLAARGDGGTGWSLAWKICFWARLGDGDRAYAMLRKLLHLTGEDKVVMNHAGGVYQNLLCAHPPFQLDGNMGGAAGIAEMLMQSHNGVIQLLPALPKAWPEGNVRGLLARGGCVVDLEWKEGKLLKATLHSAKGGRFRVMAAVPLTARLQSEQGNGFVVVDVMPGESVDVVRSN